MRRTPLARRTELRADPEKQRAFVDRSRRPLRRTAAIKKRNPKRWRRLRLEQFGEESGYPAWLRSQGCLRCGRGPAVCHHVRTRGAGGRSVEMVPLCPACHDEGHVGGWQTFERKTGLDLRMEADRLWLSWAAWLGGRYGPPG